MIPAGRQAIAAPAPLIPPRHLPSSWHRIFHALLCADKRPKREAPTRDPNLCIETVDDEAELSAGELRLIYVCCLCFDACGLGCWQLHRFCEALATLGGSRTFDDIRLARVAS